MHGSWTPCWYLIALAVRRHRDRAAATVDQVADVLRDAAERLLDRLDDTNRRFTDALDVGGRGVVAPLLRARGMRVVSCDLSPAMAALNGGPCVAADEEFLPFAPASFDLIVASLSLHWINDLPGALLQLRQALRPGRPAACQPARARHAGGTACGADRGRSRNDRRRVAPGLAVSRSCGTARICCNGRASRFRSRMWRRSGCSMPIPFALLTDLRAAGETNAIRQRARQLRRAPCSRRRWRGCRRTATGGGDAADGGDDGLGTGIVKALDTAGEVRHRGGCLL